MMRYLARNSVIRRYITNRIYRDIRGAVMLYGGGGVYTWGSVLYRRSTGTYKLMVLLLLYAGRVVLMLMVEVMLLLLLMLLLMLVLLVLVRRRRGTVGDGAGLRIRSGLRPVPSRIRTGLLGRVEAVGASRLQERSVCL